MPEPMVPAPITATDCLSATAESSQANGSVAV